MFVHKDNADYCSIGNCILDKNTLLFGCKNSKIPNGVKEISEYAFNGCSHLKSIEIPASVVDTTFNAFAGCSGLERIKVAKNNPQYQSINNCLLTKDGKELITGCKASVIPDGVIKIGRGAFSGQTELEDITIPNSVNEICYEAFNNCSNISSLDIPHSVERIDLFAFTGCRGLSMIKVDKKNPNYCSKGNCLLTKDGKTLVLGCQTSKIPDGVECINMHSFSYSKVHSIFIPKSVKEIGFLEFWGCTKLSHIEVERSNPYFCSKGNCILTNDGKTLIHGCASSVIPYGVTTIESYAFCDCEGLEKINIPDTVTDVYCSAFSGCSKLSSINFSNANIFYASAFQNCFGLMGKDELNQLGNMLW